MMKNWITLPLLALSLSFAGTVWAQSTDTATDESSPAEETTTNTEEAATDNTAGGLSMGSVDGEVEPGQPYARETFNDWELRCVKAPDETEICQLYQLLRDAGGNSVAEFNMFPLPAGGQAVAGANIVTPLETLLTAQLRLAVDSGQAKRYPYSFCSQIGCFSRIGLTSEEVAQFRKGAKATVIIVPAAAPNETVDLTLSLSGFTAGYNALVAAEKARADALAGQASE